MIKPPTFDEIQTIISKLASIPLEERAFYIEDLSMKMADTTKKNREKCRGYIRQLFKMIDEGKNR